MRLFTIAGILLLGFISLAKSEETDPKVILKKSSDALSQLTSYKADMVIESFAALTPQSGVIYQKKQPDGTMAMRMEMASPTKASVPGASASTAAPPAPPTYTLMTPQGTYTVIGDRALKMNIMAGREKMKGILDSERIKNITQDAQAGQLNITMTSGVFEGKECWIISIPTSPAVVEAVKKAMSEGPQKDLLAAAKINPSAIPIPLKTSVYLDKQSCLIVKQESLDGNDKIIQSTSYKNVQINLNLDDSLFELPGNVKIEDMSSVMQQLYKTINKK